VEFHLKKLQRSQSKIGQILLTPADLTKSSELTIQPYVTVNGMTRSSNLIDPPFGTSLGIATDLVKLASDTFDLASRIYDKVTPCIKVGPMNSNGNNAYSVQISNCSNQYEHVYFHSIPQDVVASYSLQEFDMAPHQPPLASQIALKSQQSAFSVIADVIMNVFGYYHTVATSSAGAPVSPQGKKCLIATAAYGSELMPEVQMLRHFRDGLVMHTFAGGNFMNVFNGWYYSFSPSVAAYEGETPWLRQVVRTSISPLLTILDLSSSIYKTMIFNSELAVVFTGLVASTLIGGVYFAPIALGLSAVSRNKVEHFKFRNLKIGLIVVWGLSIIAISAGEFTYTSTIMMFGTGLFVLSGISTIIILYIYLLKRFQLLLHSSCFSRLQKA
jgi:hypothetical protein